MQSKHEETIAAATQGELNNVEAAADQKNGVKAANEAAYAPNEVSRCQDVPFESLSY